MGMKAGQEFDDFVRDRSAVLLRTEHEHVTVRVDPSLGGTVRHYFYVTSASVTFSDFGRRQIITAPQHTVPVFGRG